MKRSTPPIDGDVVDLDTAFDQEFFDVAIRQALAQVPAHRQHDDVGGEAEARRRPSGRWEPDEGGAFSCRQSGYSKAVTANATAPLGGQAARFTIGSGRLVAAVGVEVTLSRWVR